MIQADTLIQRSPEILHSIVDNEIIMMNIETGKYFGVDDIGGRIWELIENPMTFEALCNTLQAEYEVDEQTCIADTKEFLDTLIEKKIIAI